MKLDMPCMSKTLKKNITFPVLVEVCRWAFMKARAELWKTSLVDLKRSLNGYLKSFWIILVILALRTVLLFINLSTLLKTVL